MAFTFYRFGSNSQKIWLHVFNYSCTSNDSCLTSCQQCPIPMSENHNCYHYEDVTLECGM